MPSPERLRVLHVLGSLNRGGVETWLLHVLRNTWAGWSTEFLLHRHAAGAYDREACALGAVLRYSKSPKNPTAYTRGLQTLLRVHGPYDALHSHVHFYSGVVLRAAALAGVPVRVAHSHTTEPPQTRGYGALMRHWIQRHATHCLATSAAAAEVLFGSRWCTDARGQMHEAAVDFRPFASLPGREQSKRALGVPHERVVIGHVGRFVKVKNHTFLVSTLAELVRLGVNAHLLLVGTGPLEAEMRERIAAAGLAERCTLAGAHNDVTPFYAAFDLFVFPSLWEGLPLATLEAQAAGVPVLASHAVPAEASVIPGLMHYLSLDEGPVAWARAAQHTLTFSARRDRQWSAGLMARSRFSIERSVQDLFRIYSSARASRTILSGGMVAP
jgi:glycosyltransferase involved in cell wall biosynthesis